MLNKENIALIQKNCLQRSIKNENAKISSDRVVGVQHIPKIYQTSKNITISPIMMNRKLKICKKENQKEDYETLIMQQEIWGKEQKQEKMSENKRSKKNSDLDILTAIAALFLLFLVVFHLAPNQYYSPMN